MKVVINIRKSDNPKYRDRPYLYEAIANVAGEYSIIWKDGMYEIRAEALLDLHELALHGRVPPVFAAR